MLHRIFAAAVCFFGVGLASAAPIPPVVTIDLLLVNGRIWTGDPARPEVTVLAVHQGRVLFARTADEAVLQAEELRKIVATRVIDLGGRRVVPGFYDSHLHLLGAGRALSAVALKDAKDEAEFGQRLKDFDRKLPRERWMVGGQWDHDRALKGELPTAALIDRFVSDRPVALRRYDGHMGVANTRALQLAGITASTQDPVGGVIYRDKDGNPTGLLRDNAMSLVEKLVPLPDDAEIGEAIKAALDVAKAHGVTSAVDMDGSDGATRRKLFRLFQRMAKDGTLTMRIDLRWPILASKELTDVAAAANFGGDWVTIGGVKAYIDGSLGSSTAKMFEPYVNEPNSTGVHVTPPGILKTFIDAADRGGLSVAVHAIGDKGNSDLLDIYRDVARANGPRDRRFRIEHAQHLRPEDYKRFAELNVVASMQPYHIADDGRWAEGRIGAKRCASSYANRSLLDAGAKLAFGSDWPVAPISVLAGIDAAVNRRTLDGKHPGGWFPEQKITVQEALAAYTTGSAYAAFQEKDRGTLAAGRLADLVVLSRDILDPAEKDHIGKAEVLTTVVGGKVVFEKK